jgi:ketosteroid isomerase-like protein
VTTAEFVIAALRNGDYAALTERYAPDALLDMDLPAWRFQLQGAAAAREYFEEQFGDARNLRCTHLREIVAGDAVVVESECRFDGDDGEYMWRAVDVFHLVGGEVVEHAQHSTGCWSPADIARQSAEAPMVRW